MYETVLIIGLGQMGGSLATALRSRNLAENLLGVDHSPEAREQARKTGWFSEVSDSFQEFAVRAELVVLAVPCRAIVSLATAVAEDMRPRALLTDLGSVKAPVCEVFNECPTDVEAIGSHPMAGTEGRGIAAANPNLFEGAWWALTPCKRTSKAALAEADSLARALGARPYVVEAETHDRAVATVSHLPYLLSLALAKAGMDSMAQEEAAALLAASGFRDTTRLAAGEPSTLLDILKANRKEVATSLRHLQTILAQASEALESGDFHALEAYAPEVAQWRREWKMGG